MGLLHKAVSRNCTPMVELLLRYVLDKATDNPRSEQTQQVDALYARFIFKPDATGPAGLTPLHVAVSKDGSEHVLDALTDDPGLVGIQAWKNARDSMGFTPYDYACLRGHDSYTDLVQRKIKKRCESKHVVLDIPGSLMDCNKKPKDVVKSLKATIFQTEMLQKSTEKLHCRMCEKKIAYGNNTRTSLVYRPAVVSLVAIAAVCVCVALIFRGSPEVINVLRPFRWELLKYGSG
ncbi:Squamosa promoter-binding protein putative isoform 2 [Tripterygium wilfordii]|uniref:Squamosa promoter-binding protein putative isoform 2 n=1 Tax=Tripterygium wilfordii TaxID=458696 RepID=A0A7J7CSM9_TRIWF|nr:Squamosa promoter-binding protein putative isoform 2 [Tripterygium wilfordii]